MKERDSQNYWLLEWRKENRRQGVRPVRKQGNDRVKHRETHSPQEPPERNRALHIP